MERVIIGTVMTLAIGQRALPKIIRSLGFCLINRTFHNVIKTYMIQFFRHDLSLEAPGV